MTTFKLYSLIFIKNNQHQILLGYKRRGLGADLWNGFGGKVEPNETVLKCAHRELNEESNLQANLTEIGIITYIYEDNKSYQDVVHIFTSNDCEGIIKESEEMSPIQWFKFDEIPYDKMWPDCVKFIKYVLKNIPFKGVVTKNKGEITYMEITC